MTVYAEPVTMNSETITVNQHLNTWNAHVEVFDTQGDDYGSWELRERPEGQINSAQWQRPG